MFPLAMSEIEYFPAVSLLFLIPVFHIFPIDQLITHLRNLPLLQTNGFLKIAMCVASVSQHLLAIENTQNIYSNQ